MSELQVNGMNSLTYHQNGDYLIPNLNLEEAPVTTLTKYGRMRKKYLQEQKPILYNHLILSGKLQQHLLEIQEAAQNRIDQMVSKMAKSSGVTEALKAQNEMDWVRQMNMLKMQAEETILAELIFA